LEMLRCKLAAQLPADASGVDMAIMNDIIIWFDTQHLNKWPEFLLLRYRYIQQIVWQIKFTNWQTD
jgi:hypothetical protein